MSEPIQSIAQNNYILATQQEVSHDNSLSGNGTVESPLSVVPGYNETVLWEDTTGSSACTLSEPMTNFKSIKILFGNGAGAGAYKDQYGEYYEADSNFTDFNYVRGKGNANVWWSWIRVAATDRSNITVPAAKSFNFGAQTATSWQNPSVSVNNTEDRNCLYKVIGINRIANN